MKWRSKILVSLFIIPLLLVGCYFSIFSFSKTKAESPIYQEKIFAVVYDNSWSMNAEHKNDYAKYALQSLISILDSKDSLKIFPLNKVESVDVDLSKEDRESEVARVIANSAFTLNMSSSTPPDALGRATKWLEQEKGLSKEEKLSDREYFLIILSDGSFNKPAGQRDLTTSDIVKSYINDYVGLQTIYFGIKVNETVEALAKENSAVSDYNADSTAKIISTMQEITNRTTGRYTMKGPTLNGNTMEVDLSTCGFSVVSMAILAQGDGGSVKLNSVQCSTSETGTIRPCSISEPNVGLSGYSATIVPKNSKGYFSGDKLTLTFDNKPKDVVILLEPAIKLQATLQNLTADGWKDVTIEDVNTNLKIGTQIRTSFKLLDGMTNKDLSDLLRNNEVKVSYNSKAVEDYESGFALESGRKEVSLSVVVDIEGSKYTLYNSWLCDVDENPQAFRLEASHDSNYGNPEQVKIDYTVYYNDQKVSKSDFEGSLPKFTYQILSLKKPTGEDMTVAQPIVNNDGTISVLFDITKGEYGKYNVKLKIVCTENKRYRTSEQDIKYYPNSLTAILGETEKLTLTTNQLKKNTLPYEFSLFSNGYPMGFDSGLISYTLKIDGVDVTSHTQIEGNKLSFIPSTATMTGQLQNIADRKIQLEAWIEEMPSVKCSQVADISIIKPTYVVEVINGENTSVDIYDLSNSTATIYYKIGIDGEWFSKEQLIEGIENKLITFDTHPMGWLTLLPTKLDMTVEELNGDAVICFKVGSGWFAPLDNLFASFIFTGDKPVEVKYGDAVGEGIFTLNEVSFGSRLWRYIVIVVVAYIITHIILWILGFFIAKSLPKGVMVRLSLHQNYPAQLINVSTKPVNINKKAKLIWHLKRFIPFMEFKNQESVTVYGMELYVTKERARRMKLLTKLHEVVVLADDEDKTYLDYVAFKRKWRNYQSGARRPSLEVSTKKLNYLLEDRDKEYAVGRSVAVNETCYATKDERGRIATIIFFIQTK